MLGSATGGSLWWVWNFDPLELAPVLLVVLLYARRARTLAARGRTVPRARRLAFYGGMAVVVLAVVSPIDTVGEERLLFMHMTQHILIGDLGALLVVVGLTGPLLRPLLALPYLGRLRVLAHPLVALPVWAANLYVWHSPLLYQAALRHDPIHALEHGLFFVTGALMWAALIEPLPGPDWFGAGWKMVYVIVVRALTATLGYIFMMGSRPYYSWYAHVSRLAGASPVTDQTIAGEIMLLEGMFVTLIVLGWLLGRFIGDHDLRQTLLEAGVDEHTASRAARYRRRPVETPLPKV